MQQKQKRDKVKFALISALSLFVFLCIWWFITDVLRLMPSTALPSPIAVVRTFFVKLHDPAPEGATLIQHVVASLHVTGIGYSLGALVGIPLGILMAWYKPVDMFVRPIFDLLRPIPGIAWIPLMLIIFGIGISSRATVIFMAAFIACLINSYSGIRQTKQVHLWVGRTFGATDFQLLLRVAIPTSLPMILTGLRVAIGASWMSLVAAELLASTRGLGFMIQQSRGIFRPDIIIAGMIAIGVIGAILTKLINLLEKKLLKGGRW